MEKPLTKAEEQLMHILWKLEKAFLKDILDAYPERPKQSTISTLLKILENKGFVDHHVYGKVHQYYPLVEKEAYASRQLGGFMKKYFNGSFQEMLSLFHRKGDLNIKELDEILEHLRKLEAGETD
ncbi:MAG: BlaI/MecI/CopY family transcriptional regulator [Bacteroidota bacterium]